MDAQLKAIQEQLLEERKLRESAEHRAEQAEDQARRTTFEELLESCHQLSQLMSVQTDKSLSTQGSVTNPKGKPCPTTILPWEDFPILRQRAFDEIHNTFHPPDGTGLRLFSPMLHVKELARTMPSRKIASEDDLKLFQHSAVENFVADVVSILADKHRDGEKWALGQGIVFENHTNTLSDTAEDVQNRLQPSNSTHPRRTPRPIQADQICVYRNENDRKDLSFLIEYKAPHKFPKEVLRAGLRTMNIPNDVINRPTIPNDPVGKFSYNADKLVAAVATQTYSYMLESGVEYSCIITGEAMVFLWIEADHPDSLHYHLAEPNEEVDTGDGLGFKHPLSAVGQLLSFCLMALRSERRNESWRDRSMRRAHVWTEDWGKIMHDIPREERKLDPPPSAFSARRYPINARSPYMLRRKRIHSCNIDDELPGDQDDGGDGPPPEPYEGPESPGTPSKRGNNSRGKRGDGRRDIQTSGAGKQRQYCTQGCLLGLVSGSALDNGCPNAPLHRRGRKGRKHLLNKQQFGTMVQRQLARTLDQNCEDLRTQGSRGALFRITLASHGYVFVGKGTRDVFVPDLIHEGRMYERLRSIQGKMMPVCLGNIDLERPWRDLGVRIVHMLLMSWGGERIDRIETRGAFQVEIERFESRIAEIGVRHEDIRLPNMLWNHETKGIMFIDLERATEVRRVVFCEVTGNGKRKRGFEMVKMTGQDQSSDIEEGVSCKARWLPGL